MPPSSSASVRRSTVESKNAPRWLDASGRLGERAVEQVGQGGEDHEHEAEPQLAGADRERRADADDQADDREVVGRQPGAPQAVAERLHRLVDRGAELAVEHVLSEFYSDAEFSGGAPDATARGCPRRGARAPARRRRRRARARADAADPRPSSTAPATSGGCARRATPAAPTRARPGSRPPAGPATSACFSSTCIRQPDVTLMSPTTAEQRSPPTRSRR